VVDIDESSARACAQQLREAGGKTNHLRVDVSLAGNVRAMAEVALRTFGRIDILCPN
jgi:NAD(P)-dependent dehydrogenase (short-subunit alcohol dehydrogenase family)